jgi:hypothetical protein
MATLQIQTTKGAPVTVIYPAERPTDHGVVAVFRAGKKRMRPAYADSSLPYLVQFLRGQRMVTFLLQDILEDSYWRRIRNAYTFLGQLDLSVDTKIGPEETGRVRRWLKEHSAARGIAIISRGGHRGNAGESVK